MKILTNMKVWELLVPDMPDTPDSPDRWSFADVVP